MEAAAAAAADVYGTVNRRTRQQLTQCFYLPHVSEGVAAAAERRPRDVGREILVPSSDFLAATDWLVLGGETRSGKM